MDKPHTQEQAKDIEHDYSIDFHAVHTPLGLTTALKQFNKQVAQAKNTGLLDQETAIGAQRHVMQAIIQVNKPTPNQKFIIDQLTAAALILGKVAVASSLIYILAGAIETVFKTFA